VIEAELEIEATSQAEAKVWIQVPMFETMLASQRLR
jgi:hypothetical protein